MVVRSLKKISMVPTQTSDKKISDQNTLDFCRDVLLLETPEEILNFLKDLCTPAELAALTERWNICKALNRGLSYRDIHAQTGSSLTTIGRVARFLKNEPYQGYAALLKKLK